MNTDEVNNLLDGTINNWGWATTSSNTQQITIESLQEVVKAFKEEKQRMRTLAEFEAWAYGVFYQLPNSIMMMPIDPCPFKSPEPESPKQPLSLEELRKCCTDGAAQADGARRAPFKFNAEGGFSQA